MKRKEVPTSPEQPPHKQMLTLLSKKIESQIDKFMEHHGTQTSALMRHLARLVEVKYNLESVVGLLSSVYQSDIQSTLELDLSFVEVRIRELTEQHRLSEYDAYYTNQFQDHLFREHMLNRCDQLAGEYRHPTIDAISYLNKPQLIQLIRNTTSNLTKELPMLPIGDDDYRRIGNALSDKKFYLSPRHIFFNRNSSVAVYIYDRGAPGYLALSTLDGETADAWAMWIHDEPADRDMCGYSRKVLASSLHKSRIPNFDNCIGDKMIEMLGNGMHDVVDGGFIDYEHVCENCNYDDSESEDGDQ